MSKKPTKEIIAIILSVAIITVVIVFTALKGEPAKSEQKDDISYYMKANGNTVSLYRGNEIIKTYDGIVIDTLPIKDRTELKAGIKFKSIEEADRSAEDYDG